MLTSTSPISIDSKTSFAFGNFTLAISSAKNDQEIYAILANNLPQMFVADRTSVTLLTNTPNQLEIFALHGRKGALSVGKSICIDTSLVGQSVLKKKTLCHQLSANSQYLDAKLLLDQGIRSCINAPIIFSDRVVGTLNIGSNSSNAYDANALELMTLISSLVSTYLEKLHLLKQAQIGVEQYKSYSKQLEALNYVAEKLSTVTTEQEVISVISDSTLQILKAERISYAIIKEGYFDVRSIGNSKALQVKMPKILPMKNTSLACVYESKQARFFNDVQNSEFIEHKILKKYGIYCSWCVPVRIKDQVVGLLNVASTQKVDGTQQLAVLQMLSGIMGATLTRIKLQGQIKYNAFYDPLTELPNRQHLNYTIDNMINGFKSPPFTLLFIDLDRFKVVNDTMGHEAGDELLCQVTRRIQQQIRKGDFVARQGGDEFIVLLHDCESKKAAQVLSERIIASVKRPFEIKRREVFIGASIGISRYPVDSVDAKSLIKYADIAMYHAKQNGRNQSQHFSKKLLEKLNFKQKLESLLRVAIEREQLYLEFQPIMNDYKISCVEALLRWQHPELGKISPELFIPIAEDSGLIEEITPWVIEKSLQTIKRLRKKSPDLYVSVNISAKDCQQAKKFQQTVLSLLHKNKLPGSALQLEITENVLVHDIKEVSKLLSSFKQHGILSAIDDFGKGFSSLTYLLGLPINTLKIDKSFIDDIQYNQAKIGVVKGIFDIANSLSVSCIAEGIESKAQHNCLTKLGCHQFQGYWFSRPLLEENLSAYIDDIIFPKNADLA